MTASANANGVNTLDLLAAKVNFTLDAPQTPPPDPCGTRQCPVPTSTPTNTPTPTPLPDIDCSDGTVDLIPSWLYPQNSVQELTDMLITNVNGIHILAGPILNGSQEEGSFSWGSKIRVYARAEFPQIGYANQVWYRVSSTAASSPVGWIVARYENVNFVSGSDPCTGVSTVSSLTFPYSRFAAANYAIEHSYKNEGLANPCAGNRVTRRIGSSNQSGSVIRFANFVYSSLDCSELGATGSAVFISEAIWAGGLPMTSPLGVTNDCDANATTNAGWCLRTVSGVDTPSNPWDKHEQIVAYFTNSLAPNTVLGYSVTNNVLPSGSKGSRLGSFTVALNSDFFTSNRAGTDSFFNNDPSGTTDFNISIPILRQGAVLNTADLESLVSPNLNSLQMGDYILIDPVGTNGGAHGLLVVGWRASESCQISVSTRRKITDFTATRVSVNTVPYVVDFTTAMSPTPRPFYCSIYNDQTTPIVGYFGRHDWYFYRVSSSITINTSQLYVHPNWQWNANSGQ